MNHKQKTQVVYYQYPSPFSYSINLHHHKQLSKLSFWIFQPSDSNFLEFQLWIIRNYTNLKHFTINLSSSCRLHIFAYWLLSKTRCSKSYSTIIHIILQLQTEKLHRTGGGGGGNFNARRILINGAAINCRSVNCCVTLINSHIRLDECLTLGSSTSRPNIYPLSRWFGGAWTLRTGALNAVDWFVAVWYYAGSKISARSVEAPHAFLET